MKHNRKKNNKSKYNPRKYKRRSLRLKGYDYSKEGLYFITICCQDNIHRFGKVENEKMILNQNGIIANTEWNKLEQRFVNFQMDAFQIMPDHIHAIVSIVDVKTDFSTLTNKSKQELQIKIIKKKALSDIVGAYKSLVFKYCLKKYKSNNIKMGKFWQRSFHDHIIRNEQSYINISNYIINNPKKWDDKFNKK